jgi:cytosine/uracil/thiamine/allantoin permease
MSVHDTLPSPKPRRLRWRIILFILLLIPAIPSIYLLIVAFYGKTAGCDPAGAVCVIGGRSLGDVAKRALDAAAAFASFFVFLGGLWFAFALIFVHRSFAGAGTRLLAALFSALWSVAGAIVMGFAALANIAPHCPFNEGGVGACRLFGVDTTGGHHIGTAIWGVMIGLPVAMLVFVVYAVVVTIIANKTKQKTLTFPPRSPS